ncbi:MAG TPA: AAA family ATPase, partial [Actinomycetota bacterium]
MPNREGAVGAGARLAATGRSKPFVGRAQDLAALRSVLRAAVEGHGSLVLLAGEPGIGKTCLAERLAIEAEAAPGGAAILWGSAWEGGAPPFWPWVQILRQLLRQLPATDEQFDALLLEGDPGMAEVARILPELAGSAPRPAELAVAPAEQARFRLFGAVAALLARASAVRPLLLVLDDLHWADMPSLRLLRFLAQELEGVRVLLLGAYRDVEAPAARRIEEVAASLGDACARLALRGLGLDEVGQLIGLTTGAEPSPEEAAGALQHAGGNPLFVREVARLLAAGVPGRAVPAGVRPVLARRLEQLRPDAAELLATASVLGTELRPELLGTLVGARAERIVALLGEAADARLVELVAGPPARWRFAHELVREVLYERLPLARRQALHRQAGEAIEARLPTDLELHLGELAGHFLHAGSAGAAKAAGYAERAGRHALDMLAWEDAAGHFQRALEALDLMPDRADRAGRLPVELTRRLDLDLELELAGVRMILGEVAAARAGYERAAVLARRLGSADHLARAALGLGAEEIIFTVDESQVSLLEEAIGQLGPGGPLRARALARLAKALEYGPDIDRRIALAGEALAIARQVGDPATLAAVLVDHHRATWGGRPPADQLDTATEIVALAEAGGDRFLALQGRLYRSLDLLELGDIVAMRAEVEAFSRGAEASRQPRLQWLSCQLVGTLALIDGRFEEVRRRNEETLVIAQRAGDPYGVMSYLGLGGVLSAVIGDFSAVVEPLRQAARGLPAFMVQAAVVVGLLNTGQPAQAREEFERLAAGDFAGLFPAASYVMNAAVASMAAYGLGDAARARVLYERLAPYAGQVIRASRLAGGCFWAV